MTPQRYQHINALADAALEVPADERSTFLDRACGGDKELRGKVEELIEAQLSSGEFLQDSLIEVLAKDLAEHENDLTGRRVEHYEVLSRLGAGGVGEVWLARDCLLDREVALKLLSPKFAVDPYHVRRFQQEARAASMLNHPNIVTIYEIGTIGRYGFIAEELIAGQTIRQKLAGGPLPLSSVLETGAQVAAALAAAHGAGIVHRDVKPENIMSRPDGVVKVLDFGLARFVEEGRQKLGTLGNDSLSRPGFVLGTVRYMSPEQARGVHVDSRSDIFSLGVVLYEMAAGSPPFFGPTPTDTLAAILSAEPPPLSRYSAGLPPEFERIVRRCLEKDRDARYANASDLRSDLLRLARRLESPAETTPHVGQPQPALPRSPRRRIAFGIAAAVVCAVLLAWAVYATIGSRRAGPSFSSMKITRLPTRPGIVDAVISPDGRYIAYVIKEAAGESLWMRQLAPFSQVQILPPAPGPHSQLVFSGDGNYLYYARQNADGSSSLYRTPALGGDPIRVSDAPSGQIAPSPDGKRFAFVHLDTSEWKASMRVANADGSGERVVATRSRPQYFATPVEWSPDGRSLICFTGSAASYRLSSFRLSRIRVSDGAEKQITHYGWPRTAGVLWPAAGDTLVVDAADQQDERLQLWTVSQSSGKVSHLTNDLNNYGRVSITSDGRKLLAVEANNPAEIWVAPAGQSVNARHLTPTTLQGLKSSVSWMPDGRIVYSAPSENQREIWVMDADGRNARQLTNGPRTSDQPVPTRDGRYIVFVQSGNIWRMNADGTNVRQLTHGAHEVHPDTSPDSRFVVYTSFANWSPSIGGQPGLWQVSIEGGKPAQLASYPGSFPKYSSDGSRIAFAYYPGKDPRFSPTRIGIIGLDRPGSLETFAASVATNVALSWSPDGKAVDFVNNAGGLGNVWRQPLTGGPPSQITEFNAGEISDFAWAPDGRRLACVRGDRTSDLVLIEDLP
jgi:serine/threonine protein kinase/Tol biopolymer transport system component